LAYPSLLQAIKTSGLLMHCLVLLLRYMDMLSHWTLTHHDYRC